MRPGATMSESRKSTIVQGEFGRLTLNLNARALVEHAHSEFNLVFKVGGADTDFRVGASTFVLTDDTAVLINPWEPHAKLESRGGATLVLAMFIQPAWVLEANGLPASSGLKLFPKSLVVLTPAAREAVCRIAMTLTSAQVRAGEPEALVRDIVCLLGAEYGDTELARSSRFSGPAMDARVMRATRYLREHVMDNPTVDDVAKEVGLSRSRFFEQFRSCIGVSPQQYLDWQRMALATRLLSEPGATVADVSERLGFSAPSHFARFFSQHIGFPPRNFQRGILTTPGPG